MADVPFKVKAVYEYSSPHDDDLSFPLGQIITVTEEEDADWYVGEYLDESGVKKDGLFPKNFVEKFEPQAPPRPTRTRAPKEPAAVSAPQPDLASAEPEQPPVDQSSKPLQSASQPAPAPTSKPTAPSEQSKAASSKPTSAAAKVPPPTVEKPSSSSFKDRIAAFNKPAAAPIAPNKPSSASTGFIKKPFVPPPPSRNAYIPPPKVEPVQKVYRRDEDPEIQERQQQDLEDAERAGLAGSLSPGEEATEEGEAPKATSLKDRIALLQKQQQEAAARRAELAQREVNPKASKPRQETSAPKEEDILDEPIGQTSSRTSTDVARDTPKPSIHRRISREPRASTEELKESDGNEADQSGAGEITEDAADESTEVEDEVIKAPQMPAHPPSNTRDLAEPTGAESEQDEEDDEEVEETEEQKEARRKAELRERMAKMSGGMGMAGMFGPPAGGMSMPPPKKRATGDSVTSPPPVQRAPMVPVPGMGAATMPTARPEITQEDDESAAPGSAARHPGDLADVEDLETQTEALDNRRAPPVPAASRPLPPSVPSDARGPPPPPPARPQQASVDYDEDEDETDQPSLQRKRTSTVIPADSTLPTRGPPPPVPGAPAPPSRPQGHRTSSSFSRTSLGPTSPPPIPGSTPTSTSEKRMSRAPPPLPIASPTMAPHGDVRPPPPPPPTAAPPSRSSTMHEAATSAPVNDDEESEYEGDYDTDIGSGVPHKDALKAHTRDSIDESTLSEDTSLASPTQARGPPPPVPSGPRNVPPPPPPHSAPKMGRQSTETGRPLRPPPVQSPDETEYDPYRYPSGGASTSTRAPVVGSDVQQESDPSLYSATSPTAKPPQLPPLPPVGSASQVHNVPPPLPPQHQTIPTLSTPADDEVRQSREAPRKSLDVPRQSMTASRRSVDQARPSVDQGQFAHDLDMGEGTQWWTRPNNPPPPLQGRNDVLCEYEESSTSKRGGRTTISRDVYVLYPDYSQSTITARFDSKDPMDVSFEQRHEPSPPRLRQDQLEQAHQRYGPHLLTAASSKANSTISDGTAQGFVSSLISALPAALIPVGVRAYGALVYANLANATVQQHDEIRGGDVISFRNAKFQGKHGAMHQKYSEDVGKPDHVGIVAEWDGTKKKVRVWEQKGEESGKSSGGKVKMESYKLGDLRSGEVKIWRVMGREWVGWDAGVGVSGGGSS